MTDKKNGMDTDEAVNVAQRDAAALNSAAMSSEAMSSEAMSSEAMSSAAMADREALSALMDGEADELETRRLLRKLPEHPALLQTWQRYHLARAVMHADAHVRPAVNLLGGIHAALADEAVPAREQHRLGRWLRVAGQSAIAASVAAFVLVGVGTLQQAGQDAGVEVAAMADDQVPELAGEYHPSGLERTVRLDSAARTRLQQAVYQFSSSPMSTSDGAPPALIFELPQTQELADPPQAPLP